MAKRFGTGELVYELDESWGRLPDGWELQDVVGVRADAQDNIVVFNRGPRPVIVLDQQGKVVATWGEGVFTRPHGLQLGPDGSVWTVDDGAHVVRKFSPDGTLLLTIGTPGVASETGWKGSYDTLEGGPPFNKPTNICVGANGDLYVSDGYGNCRVHRFSADGELIQSWGTAGRGPGQFRLPHGACAEPDGTILIGDRANDRVQRFSPSGEYLGEWSDVRQPDDIFLDGEGRYYVAELGYGEAAPGRLGARVTVRDRDGRVLSAWGDEGDPSAPGNMAAPHGVCTDRCGCLYVGEVTYTARISRGLVPPDTHRLQRFVRAR